MLRKLLWTAIYGALGSRLPEAYEVVLPRCGRLYVLGPYTTPCGGCDRILPFALVPQLIQKYAQHSHVLFEGLLMSTFYGAIGKLMEQHDSVVMFLDTPLKICIARVEARRTAAGNFRPFNPKLLIEKHRTIARLQERFGERAVSVKGSEAPATILRLLPVSRERVRALPLS